MQSMKWYRTIIPEQPPNPVAFFFPANLASEWLESYRSPHRGMGKEDVLVRARQHTVCIEDLP